MADSIDDEGIADGFGGYDGEFLLDDIVLCCNYIDLDFG